jgi:hypothetical protein
MIRDSFNAVKIRQNQRSENVHIDRGQCESFGGDLIWQLSLAQLIGLFPWLFTMEPFTQIDLAIAGEGGRQVIVRINFWAWLTSTALLDLYRF